MRFQRKGSRAGRGGALELRPDYSGLKRKMTADVRKLAGPAVPSHPEKWCGPWEVSFSWREPNRHRDIDGVRAGSKFVLDGLVAAGVLPTDGQKCIDVIGGDVIEVGSPTGVYVEIIPAAGPPWSRFLEIRLPDHNEIIEAARLEGARRERARWEKRWRRP